MDGEESRMILASTTKRQQFARKTVIGEFRNPCRFTWVEWTFLVVASITMLGALGVTMERFFYFEKDIYNLTYLGNDTGRIGYCTKWHCSPDFILSVTLLVNLGFCLFYCYNSLFRDLKFELFAFVGAIVAITCYIIANYVYDCYVGDVIHAVKKVRLGLICFFGPLNIILALASYWKMGYLIFNVIGSNAKLIRAYNTRSMFVTLQYFHFEIMANVFVLSFASDGLLISTGEKVVLTISLTSLVGVMILGYLTVYWEKLPAAIVWYILMFITTTACYSYKLIEVSLNLSDYIIKFEEHLSSQPEPNTTSLINIGIILIITVVLGALASVLLMINMGFVIRSFNGGLREKVDPPFKGCVDALMQKLYS